MTFVEQTEFTSFRTRVYSLEGRLVSLEYMVIEMFQDISRSLSPTSDARLPVAVTTLKTPTEIIKVLRARHPDLATHPTLWCDLE